MKNAVFIFCSISLVCTLIFGCNPSHNNQPAATATVAAPAGGSTGKLAYVNIDTLEAKYELLKTKREEFKKSLETRKKSLTDQLMKEQDDFNKDLKTRLDAFIEDYNKDKRYDFIFTYS